MPSSDHHAHVAQPRAGRRYEDDLQLRYLAPGAFTVLPPDDRQPAPDPPPAPEPYRLTPSTRHHKNQSFAILGEVDPGRPPSRGSSPTGRVSPFRGRGFNPSGSRHASPAPSPPPPEDARLTPTTLSPRHGPSSKIPQLKRRGSNNFGEKVFHHEGPSPSKKKSGDKLSGSLTDLGDGNRPPPTPKRTAFSKAPAFQTLSPIAGSSPDSNKSLSSPSRIPKSRSTPPSRRQSPTRTSEPKAPATVTRHPSRSQSRSQSRVQSRDSSPKNGTPTSTRTPSHRYKNVQAKVNTFNKPKVPPKPQVLSETSDSDLPKTLRHNRPLNRKESLSRLRTNGPTKTGYSSTSDSSTSATKNFAKSIINNASKNVGPKELVFEKNGKVEGASGTSGSFNSNKKTDDVTNKGSILQGTNNKPTNNPEDLKTNSIETKTFINPKKEPGAGDPILHTKKPSTDSREALPSTTTVVSSTTTTVTQPLKIDTNLPTTKPKSSVSPMVDGRVLSATSVSNAMNKMNDSVMDTQTLIKDHGFPKLSPAANAVISMNSDPQKASALDTKNATTALPKVEPILKDDRTSQNNHHTNHVSHVMSSKALEMEVQKNLGKLIPEGVSDKVKEARTVVAHDVQPIRITVREKPGVEVQSGNVRLASGISNGLNERPSLPPSQRAAQNEPEKEPPPKNGCARFFSSCKRGACCTCCRGPKKKSRNAEKAERAGCLDCLKKKKRKDESAEAPAVVNVEDETGKKKGRLLDRIKCCGKQKVKDSSCFPLGKRRENWAERRDSILSNTPPQTRSSRCSKDCCKNFLRTIFCVGLCGSCCSCCKKKVVEEPMRKSSVMSKKKSLTPTTLPPPPEESKPKIDMSLVEHNSVMKGAIPVLPVCLAWFCLIMNCILPGTGTFLSGFFCLCLGIPRFSQKDGPKPRIGSFLINIIIACGQFFTVLFCLVGWGWSIWWGVIMLKVAKKHRKLKHLEKLEQESFQPSQRSRDPERGS